MSQNFWFPADIWQLIGENLDSDDLFSMAATCKTAYRAFCRNVLKKKISFPLKEPHRLTFDQRECIKNMEKIKSPFKLLCAPVGAGKSITSISYGLRNVFDRIYIVSPPNLIQMWWDTVINFFKIEPLVLHSTNPKYHRGLSIYYEQKIIITSYKIFDKIKIINPENSLLIVDEAHHSFHLFHQFKEILSLSATVFKKEQLSSGIKNLCDVSGIKDISDITFKMEKIVIGKKLKEVIVFPYYIWQANQEVIDKTKKELSLTKDNKYSLRDVGLISEMLTHPYTIHKACYFKEIKIRKKKLYILNAERRRRLEIEVGKILGVKLGWESTYEDRLLMNNLIDEQCEPFYQTERRKCMKYYQCYEILKQCKERGEKALIFDNSTTWLPVLCRFLMEKNIETYLFTTHYDVKSRQRQLEIFQTDKDAVALLSSTTMLGEGQNITQANHVIFLAPNLNENIYYQCIGRCWRYPQKKHVFVYHLFVSEFEKAVYDHAYGRLDMSTLDLQSLLTLPKE